MDGNCTKRRAVPSGRGSAVHSALESEPQPITQMTITTPGGGTGINWLEENEQMMTGYNEISSVKHCIRSDADFSTQFFFVRL
jgi:hypothetical protein